MVDSEFRRNGLCERLVAECEKLAEEKGARRIEAVVDQQNVVAVKVLVGGGYSNVLLFEKDLTASYGHENVIV